MMLQIKLATVWSKTILSSPRKSFTKHQNKNVPHKNSTPEQTHTHWPPPAIVKPINSKDTLKSQGSTEYPVVETAGNTSLTWKAKEAASVFYNVRVAQSVPTPRLRIAFSCLKHIDD